MVVAAKSTFGVVVIALGNRFRADDGVGLVIAAQIERAGARCRVLVGAEDALSLVAAWEGAGVAVVLDAAASGAAPGTIHRLEAGDEPLPRAIAGCSSHGLGLAEAVALAKALGRLPGRLVIYAIEAKTLEAGAALSPEVAAAAREVARRVAREIAAWSGA